MPRLNSVEARIVRSMLGERFGPGSPLVPQVEYLQIKPRHLTGVGYWADFQNTKEVQKAPVSNTELSEDYRTKKNAPLDLVGFTLFIRDGYLSSFEGYTYGDIAWPDEPIEEWLILDPVEAPQQKAK